MRGFIALLFALVFSAPCPNPLDAGAWLGGTCFLQPNTTIGNGAVIDLNNSRIDCNYGPGIRASVLTFTLMRGAMTNCNKALLLLDDCTVTVWQMNFTNCTTSAIEFEARTDGKLIVNSSRFEHCNASQGGALYAHTTNVSVDGCAFLNCSSNAIQTLGGHLSIASSTFQECISPLAIYGSSSMRSVSFDNCTGGDIVSIYGGPVQAECMTFSNCSADGALISNVNSETHIVRINFLQNSARWMVNAQLPGSVYLSSYCAIGTTLSFNKSNESALVVSIEPPSCFVLQCTPFSAQYPLMTSSNAMASTSASAIYWTNPTLTSDPIILDTPVVIHGMTLELTSTFQGALITAPSIQLSGTLVIDLSAYDGEYEAIQLFEADQAEGAFDAIVIDGLSCIQGEMQGYAVFFINTCSSAGMRIALN